MPTSNLTTHYHPRTIDMTGQRIGRLIVIKSSPFQKRNGHVWECQCDCGRTVHLKGGHLRSKSMVSCGCYRDEHFMRIRIAHYASKSPTNAAINQLIKNYRQSAKSSDREWALTTEQFVSLTQLNCTYCGVEPSQTTHPNNGTPLIYNGIDRVDNTKGYTLDNVVPCCRQCNFSKRTLTVDEFKKWVIRIYNHLSLSSD